VESRRRILSPQPPKTHRTQVLKGRGALGSLPVVQIAIGTIGGLICWESTWLSITQPVKGCLLMFGRLHTSSQVSFVSKGR